MVMSFIDAHRAELGIEPNGNPALGRLVQLPPPVRPHRTYPVRRGRGALLCSARDPRYGCKT